MSEKGERIITFLTEDGNSMEEIIPVGPSLMVKVGDKLEAGSKLTADPNVGGFGQLDTEVVLQDPLRVIGLIVFFAGVTLAQIMLVLKKKQVEKVQSAEGI